MRTEIESLRQRLEKCQNELADALDLKCGTGPTALSMVVAERDSLRQQIAQYQKDTKVCRWLLDGGINSLPYEDYGLGPVFDLSAEAIKAAMKEGE